MWEYHDNVKSMTTITSRTSVLSKGVSDLHAEEEGLFSDAELGGGVELASARKRSASRKRGKPWG